MELARFPSRGGFSVRSILTFAITVLAVALLWAVFLPSASVNAAPSANWSGDTILYDYHGYNLDKDFKDTTGTIPNGATVYTSAVQNTGSTKRIFILFFSPGVDPPKATSVNYVEFDYKASSATSTNTTAGGIISNPQNATTVSLTLKGKEDALSSCSVEGVGWLVCPISVFLAGAMDWLFDTLSSMIAVTPPVLGDTSSSMYAAWNAMRSFANVAFVIAFLIIIYAQLTNWQISNYGLKKLIPRLIVGAVLVNVSFYIAAIAIDASNILGYSVQDVFNNLRDGLFHMTNDDSGAALTQPTWTSIAGVVLAGGGLIGGIYYMASGGLYLLITLLIGLVLTILFVVIILAARQAIIIILVIISPLAFVANLLPNTEKWFSRWKDLFMTMLIFFPAFSVVFGGSQLAGGIILQNAGDNIVMLLFGLAVQVAPLVITPLILKLSGGLLGKIANITNNPRKGLIDRNRDWAQRRAAHLREKNKTLGTSLKRLHHPTSWGAGMVRAHDNAKQRLEDNTAMWKQRASNRYNTSRSTIKIQERMHGANLDKEIIESNLKTRIQNQTNSIGGSFYSKNIHLEAAKRALEESVKIGEANIKEFENGKIRTADGRVVDAGSGIVDAQLEQAIKSIQASRQSISVETMRGAKADEQLQRTLADALSNSLELRTRAGGIREGGIDSVLAAAKVAVQKANAEDIKNIQDASGLKPGDLGGAASELMAAIAEGNSIRARAFQNILITAGGSGMDKFRETITNLGVSIPVDVAEDMRENLLANHGAIKAKANDLIDWAAKGDILATHTTSAKAWAAMSDNDFIGQHPKTQGHALDTRPYDRERAQSILAADKVAGNILSPEIKKRLEDIQ